MQQTCELCEKYSNTFYCTKCVKLKIDENYQMLNEKGIQVQQSKAILGEKLQKINNNYLCQRKIRILKHRIELLKQKINEKKQQISKIGKQVETQKQENLKQQQSLRYALDGFYALKRNRVKSTETSKNNNLNNHNHKTKNNKTQNKSIHRDHNSELLTIERLSEEKSQLLKEMKRKEFSRKRFHRRNLCCSLLLHILPIATVPISRRLQVREEPRIPEYLYIVHDRICFPVSGNFDQLPPETVAAGLGYIALIVHLLAAYLRIPLPYPLRYRGSRSVVVDPPKPSRCRDSAGSACEETVYPLYYPGSQQQDMFDAGIRLLGYNIAQICALQGIQCPVPSPMLLKLYLIVRFKNIGIYGPFKTLSQPISPTETTHEYYHHYHLKSRSSHDLDTQKHKTVKQPSQQHHVSSDSHSNSTSNKTHLLQHRSSSSPTHLYPHDPAGYPSSSLIRRRSSSHVSEDALTSNYVNSHRRRSSAATDAVSEAGVPSGAVPSSLSSNSSSRTYHHNHRRHKRKTRKDTGLGESIYFGYVPVEEDDGDGGWENIIVDQGNTE
eukprot:gb/GECH01014659.1/.p1 GENE.gb/GECH01014659.1/~~gb/GECH01014659.1/.p1  ORF type:complete len:552 (+),score=146.86 gb/GECH01014659.1/:1-1656(+)